MEPRDGRQILHETTRFAREVRSRSWLHLAATLIPLAAALAVIALPIHWALRLPASVAAGLLLVRLFVIYHDHMHGAIFAGSPLGSAILRLCGLLVMAPPGIWKETHDHHHRNNARNFGMVNVGSFPVLTTEQYREASFTRKVSYILTRHPLVIALGYLTVFLFGFCLGPLLVDPRRHLDGILALFLHAGLLAALFLLAGPDVALLAVVIPCALGGALGSYLFYAQHNFPAAEIRSGGDWDYVHAALRSSSYMVMNPVLRWFTANIGLHHVHHLNSRIPFYRLPEAMEAIGELQSAGRTSLRPADMVRCLRLKLWDPRKNRLVTFREGLREAA